MERTVRRKLEMAVHADEFNQAQPFADPTHAAVAARFAEGLVRAQAPADGRGRFARCPQSDSVPRPGRTAGLVGKRPDVVGPFRSKRAVSEKTVPPTDADLGKTG